jgi:hypothetical protein
MQKIEDAMRELKIDSINAFEGNLQIDIKLQKNG